MPNVKSFEDLVQVFAGDKEIATEALAVFLETCSEMRSSWDSYLLNQESDKFAGQCHAIKGAISLFGFSDLCAKLKNLEISVKKQGIEPFKKLINEVQIELDETISLLKKIQVSGK